LRRRWSERSAKADSFRRRARSRRAQITDYWIVNLVERVLEVYREPARHRAVGRRWSYGSIETLDADSTIAPLAALSESIRVADLLP
jgi:hypothetical protein